MKILFNNSIFFVQKNGGISRYFCSIGNEIINLNQNLKIVAPINKNNLLKKIPKKNKFSFYLKRYPILGVVERLNNYITDFYSQKYKPDIFHETYYSSYKFNNSKFRKIITIYDLIHEKFPNYFLNYKKYYKKHINNYDHYICISENTKKDFMNFYKIPEKKISVIYLAGSHYRETSKKIELNQINNKYQSKEFFLFVGSRDKYKNFKLILECFKKKKDLQSYKIVCFGGGNFNKKELDEFKDLKIEHINGDDQTLIDLYKNAICLILPSEYEGFGIPVLEAMELGCPVVSSSTEALKEIGSDAAMYFNPYSVDELYTNLLNVIDNTKKREDMIIKGVKRSQSFSWKKSAEQTLELYKSLL